MISVWLPLAATVFAAALTYVCCIRPMRKQDGCCHEDQAGVKRRSQA